MTDNMAPDEAEPGGASAVVYHHPGRRDTWVLHPDGAGDVTLDARVVGLMLEAAGYVRQHQDT